MVSFCGKDVFFLTGSDEHGAKVAKHQKDDKEFEVYLKDKMELAAAEAKAHGIELTQFMDYCREAFGVNEEA